MRLIANKIALAYPEHTVIYAPWDDPSKSYPAGSRTTIQTGSNGRTITIWNGSVSGSVIAYARDNLTALVSGGIPDVIFMNFGHNSPQLIDDYRAIHQETVQNYINRYPNAAMILMTQNPRAITDPDYANDQGKQQAIYQLAVMAGHDIVDINEAFRLYGDYATDLLNPDGLHPNDAAGSPMWADIIWETVKPSRVALAPGYQSVSTRIWVPAMQFLANEGSPSLAVHYGVPVWELDPSVRESISCVADIPSSWKRQNIRAIWTSNNAAVSKQVTWTGDHMYIGEQSGGAGAIQMGTFLSSGSGQSGAQTVAGKNSQVDIWQRIALGASPVALRVGRDGGNAADTLASDAYFVGLMIDRAY
ncbi:MAG: SGNH/GDSL hydrolase family protein [Acidobacteria bacterium]|nr:SGNH/GDSL hydrolase family protein [Acidobacteriota bacterium]